MKIKPNSKADIEDDEDEKVVGRLGYLFDTITTNHYRVYLDESVKMPSYYSAVFDMLLGAKQHDTVTFFISSPGGRIDGLNVLLEGIRLSEASVCATLVGDCSSAASILALNCDQIIVLDSATMLCHNASYGSSGKAADIAAHVTHFTKVAEKLMRSTYEGFLSEAEIQQMLDGKEFYFDADEIRSRIEARDALFQNDEDADE